MTPCAIVPSHNHWTALAAVLDSLRHAGLTVFLIDDGSAEPARSALQARHDPEGGVLVTRLEPNQGKGAAVLEGFRQARAAGFTHALQVDADGQHDLSVLPALLDLAGARPEALITGLPQYDASMPLGRRVGRWITHVWVWIETLSFEIQDSMCGLRVYPLEPVQTLLRRERVGLRMDFDTDIMVRLAWRGTPVLGVPVKVIYPPGNSSNFDLWRDNLRISRMHARLVLTGLARLLLTGLARLRHRAANDGASAHWADLAERGALWGLTLTAWTYRHLGRAGCRALLAPVVAWFTLRGGEQRRASRRFLGRVWGRPAGLWDCYRHFLSFAERALDGVAAWSGGLPAGAVRIDTPDSLAAATAQGALILVAHHGNVEVARAMLDEDLRRRMTVLVHTRHAGNYNRTLRRFNPAAALNLLEVSEIGPETAVLLKERVERGGWVVMAADRVPVGSRDRIVTVPFLGEAAPFSQGPWILAALLGCPVHLLFCVKDGDGWRLRLEPFADRIDLPRREREQALAAYAAAYAARLETEARRAPLQWFNFFDIWSTPPC